MLRTFYRGALYQGSYISPSWRGRVNSTKLGGGGGGTGTELFTCPYPLKVQVQPTTNCLYKSGISIPNIAYLCLTYIYIYGLRT